MNLGLRTRRGFVVVDVLTALAMLAATLSFGLMALTTALKVESSAREDRAADGLLRDLAERPYPSAGVFTGRQGGLAWRAQWEDISANPALTDCRLTLTATSGGRDYALSTVRACPSETAE